MTKTRITPDPMELPVVLPVDPDGTTCPPAEPAAGGLTPTMGLDFSEHRCVSVASAPPDADTGRRGRGDMELLALSAQKLLEK